MFRDSFTVHDLLSSTTRQLNSYIEPTSIAGKLVQKLNLCLQTRVSARSYNHRSTCDRRLVDVDPTGVQQNSIRELAPIIQQLHRFIKFLSWKYNRYLNCMLGRNLCMICQHVI